MPRKRLVIILVIVTILGIGGYFVYQQVQTTLQKQVYDASPDRLADDFLAKLKSQDIKGSMGLFSPYLNSGYGEEYWKTTVFGEIGGYKDTPVLKAKGPVKPISAEEPSRYDPQLNQQATQYDYDFNANNATYRLSLVIFRLNGTWSINEVSGGYLP